ncbi:MAG: hypothetical protein NC918_00835 [Candidatus Omnitrophica bacterium]|nr:hypothetical protein [Candidatus Omnitrophota bacterium]
MLKKTIYEIVLFFLFFLIGYLLIPPVVWKIQPYFASIFVIFFSLSMLCFIKKISYAFSLVNKLEHIWLLISSIFGIGLLPACTIVCNALNIGLLSGFSLFFVNIIPAGYSTYILIFLIITQIFIMLHTKCFQVKIFDKNKEKLKEKIKDIKTKFKLKR